MGGPGGGGSVVAGCWVLGGVVVVVAVVLGVCCAGGGGFWGCGVGREGLDIPRGGSWWALPLIFLYLYCNEKSVPKIDPMLNVMLSWSAPGC